MSVSWYPDEVTLGMLRPWENNPRRMTERQAKRLLDSWRELGQFQTIAVGPDNEVYDGHQRLSALIRVYGPDYRVRVLRANRHLTDDERRHLTLHANNPAGSWNWDMLKTWSVDDLTVGGIIDDEAIKRMSDDMRHIKSFLTDDSSDDLDEPDGVFELRDDVMFSSELPLGLPPLRDDRLFSLDGVSDISTWVGDGISGEHALYVWNWGSDSTRGLDMSRTLVAFYVHDRRFDVVYDQPARSTTRMLNAHVAGVIVPNFSMYWDMPQIVRLWNRYRSLWCGRYFQEAGLRVLPDIQLSPDDGEYCWTGIPHGADFSTQFHTRMRDEKLKRKLSFLRDVMDAVSPGHVLVYCDVQYMEHFRNDARFIICPSRLAVKRGYMDNSW